MKRILLFLLMQGSLDCFSQDLMTLKGTKILDSGTIRANDLSTGTTVYSRTSVYDTVLCHLLITRGHKTIAHEVTGYAIYKGGTIVGYLDDNKKFILPPTKVWNHIRWQTKENHDKPNK